VHELFNPDDGLETHSQFPSFTQVFMDFVKVVEGLQFLNALNGGTAARTARGKRSLENQVDSTQNREEIEEMLETKVSSLIKEIPLIFNEFLNHSGLTVKQQVSFFFPVLAESQMKLFLMTLFFVHRFASMR
jgi:hypothetical protein